MKRVISVQIHPNRIPKVSVENLIAQFYMITKNSKEVRAIKIEVNLTRPKYINVNYKTNDTKKTWRAIQEKVLNVKRVGALIKAGSIIMCEGRKSWKDYLLLHHYDVKQKVDEL